MHSYDRLGSDWDPISLYMYSSKLASTLKRQASKSLNVLYSNSYPGPALSFTEGSYLSRIARAKSYSVCKTACFLTICMSSHAGSYVQSCTACNGTWQCRNSGMSREEALQHVMKALLKISTIEAQDRPSTGKYSYFVTKHHLQQVSLWRKAV